MELENQWKNIKSMEKYKVIWRTRYKYLSMFYFCRNMHVLPTKYCSDKTIHFGVLAAALAVGTNHHRVGVCGRVGVQ